MPWQASGDDAYLRRGSIDDLDAVVQRYLAIAAEPPVGLREAPEWRYRLRVVCTAKEVAS